MENNNAVETVECSIDDVVIEMADWRANKSALPNKSIPDLLWQKIFSLEKKLPPAKIRKLLAVNTDQYVKKYKQLIESNAPKNTQKSVPENSTPKQNLEGKNNIDALCEITVKTELSDNEAQNIPALTEISKTNKADLKKLRSTKNKPADYLDNTMMVCEFLNHKQQKLKIHVAGIQRVHDILNLFLKNDLEVA